MKYLKQFGARAVFRTIVLWSSFAPTLQGQVLGPQPEARYYQFLADPDADDVPLAEQIFDSKITQRLKDHMKGIDEPESKVKAPAILLSRDVQVQQDQRKAVAEWTVKRLAQHHGEKQMEEAPKDSAIGQVNTLRVVVQNYEVKLNEETKIDGGYDLPSNTAKAGISSWFGRHQVKATLGSGFSPNLAQAEFHWMSQKSVGATRTNLQLDYWYRAQQLRLSLTQPILDFWSLGYSQQYKLPHRSSKAVEHFVGVQYARAF